MAQEMTSENVDWESDEADWESDEAIAESDDSAEAWPWQRKKKRVRGIRGVAVRSADGTRRALAPFPKPVALAEDTNRVLGALERRVNRVQTISANNSKVSGAVNLLIGGGLAVLAVAQVSQQQGSRFTLADLSDHPLFKISALIAAGQIATTGIKAAVHGGYQPTALGTGADVGATLLLGLFGFGRVQLQNQGSSALKKQATLKDLQQNINSFVQNQIVVTEDTATPYRVVVDDQNNKLAMLVES
jgi:hypothetical protein